MQAALMTDCRRGWRVLGFFGALAFCFFLSLKARAKGAVAKARSCFPSVPGTNPAEAALLSGGLGTCTGHSAPSESPSAPLPSGSAPKRHKRAHGSRQDRAERWQGSEEDTKDFGHLISCTSGDQTPKSLHIDPLSHLRTGVRVCQAGRIPRREDSFVFLLVEM